MHGGAAGLVKDGHLTEGTPLPTPATVCRLDRDRPSATTKNSCPCALLEDEVTCAITLSRAT